MSRVRYRLSFPRLDQHLVEVEARFGGVTGEVTLCMAAWTPGSYLIREYARHVQDLEVEAGGAVEKVAKDRWRVTPRSAGELVVRYRVYAFDLTVRTNHVDSTHAFLNGAPTFLWLEERRAEPIEVTIEPPAGWAVATALAGGPTRFEARDLDELIDSPIHVGSGPILAFTAAGKPHRIAVWGR